MADDERVIDKTCQALRDGNTKISLPKSDRKCKVSTSSTQKNNVDNGSDAAICNTNISNSKKCEEKSKEISTKRQKCSSFNASSYDDIILWTLDKYYSTKNNVKDNIHDKKSSFYDEDSTEQNHLIHHLKEDDDFDDDIFVAIMDSD